MVDVVVADGGEVEEGGDGGWRFGGEGIGDDQFGLIGLIGFGEELGMKGESGFLSGNLLLNSGDEFYELGFLIEMFPFSSVPSGAMM